MQDSTFADIYFSEFFSVIFEVPVEDVAIDEEELHGIEIEGILNLDNVHQLRMLESESIRLYRRAHQKYCQKEETRRFTSL